MIFFSRIAFLAYLLPLLVLALAHQLGLAWDARNLLAWLVPAVVFGVFPLADKLVGQSRWPATAALRGADPWCRLIVWLAVPAQTVLVLWATSVFGGGGLSGIGMAGWLISTGIASAIVGIAPGHELFHKQNVFERIAGGYLFSTVGYGGSKICHCRDHHVHVATVHDAATARRGQSLYAFLPGAYAVNFKKAFLLEKARLRSLGHSWCHPANELLWWWAVPIAFGAVCLALWGAAGLAFYVAQSFVAVTILEAINYVEHYGMVRAQRADGSYEPVTARHSWNCNFTMSNMLLLNLQRHSDHHESATKRYQILVDHSYSPQLPSGYPGLLLLAFVPPLWKRVMHPLLERQ